MLADFLLANTWVLMTTAYVGGFFIVAMWELFLPRRRWSVSTTWRWTNNFGVFVVSSGFAHLALPVLIIGLALIVEEHNWGLFNVLGAEGLWITAAGILILDLAQYLEHRTVHRFSLLWRVHRMHHADFDYDLTTGLRFHPFEGLFATLWRMLTVAIFGIPVVAVIIAELLLVTTNYFVHANARLPLSLDRILRRVIITPDMHRVHHSIARNETNSNFGSIFSIWDRLFGTYVAQPRAGHERMHIGLAGFRHRKHMLLPWMLANPFIRHDAAATTGDTTPAASRPG